jgi:5'-methylthioadenosine phosphorylase
VLAQACDESGVSAKSGGTYLCMEGPAFSTKAESNVYRSWGMDVIGMTNLTEAKLAREAEICYVTVAMVTDTTAGIRITTPSLSTRSSPT